MADPAKAARPPSLQGLLPATRVMIRERRRRLCGAAEGRVLDLTGSARVADFVRADQVVDGLDGISEPPGSFDTAVAVLWLAGVPEPHAALDRVASALAPRGRLVFLEPVVEPGVGRFGQAMLSPMLHRTAGWRVDRDVPALLRAADWSIIDLERIPMPRYLWPLHRLVEGRAHPRNRVAA